ncbi:uncharacterized protein N7479_010242 [Penicillium vulpinum]|uniref:Uncharacterized protein n=1 Tax=Penicillium vulpinum TaxID=29845 RepID=A0A1V6RGT4_9EURO|nr:uncharacterized protein N7479_010242 [Penicillium vulpinum]KAJ5951829.1 hypothetical protein N7479_010242 [Penicillium vulpinum]OQE00603.1 hypothetical protein PENVUL_c049G06949 [Penicillium vulpinum]
MHHSIGICGGKNAGTLGGYMELRHHGGTHRGLLTNYHVVRPSPLHQLVEVIDPHDISPRSPVAYQRAIGIESLARKDRDFALVNIDSQLDSLDSRKASLTSSIQNRLLLGECTWCLSHRQLEILETCKFSLIATREVMKPMPHVLGEVLFASGLLIHGKRLLGLAFIKLTPEAEEGYFRANRMPEIPRNQKPSSRSSDQFARIFLPADSPIMEKGGTADVIGGVCNGVKAVCNWASQLRHDIGGNGVDMKSHQTEEYVIIVVNGPFDEKDDSGSFVLDEHGAVAGLLFADVWDGCSLVAVALTMPDIIDSMKPRLDDSVSLHLP